MHIFLLFLSLWQKVTQINEIICEFIILLWPHMDTFQYYAEYRNTHKLCLDTGYLPESAIAHFPTKGWPFNVKATQTFHDTLNPPSSSPVWTVRGSPFSWYQHTRGTSWACWGFCDGSPVGRRFHQVVQISVMPRLISLLQNMRPRLHDNTYHKEICENIFMFWLTFCSMTQKHNIIKCTLPVVWKLGALA